jgi:DUF2933 family protein
MNQHDTNGFPSRRPNWSRVNQWLLWLGLAAAVIWLVTKHGAHLLEVAPFLFILACPLMHVFGHGGHGHGGHGGPGDDEKSDRHSVASTSSTDAAPRRDS